MSNIGNVARDSEQRGRGVVVSISRKNMSWYRRLISLYLDEAKFDELLSQDELIVKQMDYFTDGGILRRIKVISKNGSVYTMEYKSSRWKYDLYKNRTFVEDRYTVEYDAKRNGLTILEANWDKDNLDLYEQALKTSRDVICIMYFLYVTGTEIVDDYRMSLERFGIFDKSPKDLLEV